MGFARETWHAITRGTMVQHGSVVGALDEERRGRKGALVRARASYRKLMFWAAAAIAKQRSMFECRWAGEEERLSKVT